EIARLSAIELTATATPPLAGNGTTSISPATLFSSPGTSNRVVVLLPAATTQVELTLTARDLAGGDAGSAHRSYTFTGPAVQADTITLLGESCAGADGGSDLAASDLAASDLAGADLLTGDLATPVQVTGVLAQGMLSTVYEAEGSTQGASSGVAV